MAFRHRESEIPAKIKRRSERGVREARLAGWVFVIEDYFSEPIIREEWAAVASVADGKGFKRRWQ